MAGPDPLAVVLAEGVVALGLAPSDRQLTQLLGFAALLMKWNGVYNLTAVREPTAVLTHHLLDCLAIVAPLRRELRAKGGPVHMAVANSLASPVTSSASEPRVQLLDVGSGGGLPGVLLAIMCAELDVTCLDAVAKKAAFVQQVSAELGVVNVRARHGRIERESEMYDVVSSRAFATLADFFSISAHSLAPGGLWLAMKGRTPAGELGQVGPMASVFHVEQLKVPNLDAQRCIVWAKKPG